MGARTKKNEQQTAKKRARAVSRDFWRHTLLRILVAALVAAGGWLALAVARDKAVDISDFQVSPANLEFISKPDWVRGPIERQLRNCGWTEEKVSLLDSQTPRKIWSWLSANPLVKEVKSVERQFPNRVRAKVELREPTAFILRGRYYYIVDGDGTRLPGKFASTAQAELELLLVVYVRSSPPPAGKKWDDPAVVEAAKLARFLKNHQDLVDVAGITAIDSSNIGGRRTPRESELVLVTADHTKIFWGRGLGSGSVTELPAQQKIENLQKVIEQAGSLSDKEYVDIRFADPVFRNRNYHIRGA